MPWVPCPTKYEAVTSNLIEKKAIALKRKTPGLFFVALRTQQQGARKDLLSQYINPTKSQRG